MYQNVANRQMQAKQLENEAKRLLIQSDIERNKARNELKKENRAAAKIYAENAVRYGHQAEFLLQNACAIQGYNANARQIQNQVGMIKTMNTAANHFQKTASQIHLSKISKEHTKKEEIKQKVNDAHDILTKSQSQELINAQAESLLASLNNEVMQEPALNIPIMQVSPNLVSSQDSFDSQSLNSYSDSNLNSPEMLTNAPINYPNYNLNSNNYGNQNSSINTSQNSYDITSFNPNLNIYCSQSINDAGLNSTSDIYGSSSVSSLNSSENIYPCASIGVNSNNYGNASSSNPNNTTNINTNSAMNSNPINYGSQIMNPNSYHNPQMNTTNIYGSSTENSNQCMYHNANAINNSNGNLNGYMGTTSCNSPSMYPNLSDPEVEKPKKSIKYSKFGRLRNSSANIMKV